MDGQAETRTPDLVGCRGDQPCGSDVAEAEFDTRLREEKLAALAEFAAGAGHEINNPLATILICAQRLQSSLTDPEQRRLVATIGGQALRVRDMIGDVMLFARPPRPRPERLDLSEVVAEVLVRFQEQFAGARIDVECDCPRGILVHADPTQLRVVLSELLRNAIEAQPGGGRIALTGRPPDDASPEYCVLRVVDAGCGLDEVTRRHLFDPFFSGRQAGRGLGFGLSKAWRIVTEHGGGIEATEPADGGLALTIYWPAGPGSPLASR